MLLASPAVPPQFVSDGVTYRWRGPVTDAEMVELVNAHGGTAEVGWWDRIRPHSLTPAGTSLTSSTSHLTAETMPFSLTRKTHGAHQRKGIGMRSVQFAAQHAKAAGCEWLHVDFDADLAPFYFDACGFRPTDAGLIHLPSLGD